MGAEALRIRQSALALSDNERADVAAELFASLDEEADPNAESEWAEEVGRRAQGVLAGTATLVHWASVDAEAARLLDDE